MRMHIVNQETFCGGFTGAILPYSPRSQTRSLSTPKNAGKRNQIFVDDDSNASPPNFNQKDQKLDEDASRLLIGQPQPEV